MKIIKQQFSVPYQYPVYFTEGLFHPGNEILADFFASHNIPGTGKKTLFVLDEGMLAYHAALEDAVRDCFAKIPSCILAPFITVPGGESAKNDPRFLEEILTAINAYKVDRHSFVVAVGGGAVLDLAGYASAVAHRGIRHIRIPTTVLSQNDSGVGVKNGINFLEKKNFLGTFSPPYAVFNDIQFLSTLDDRNWHSGMAEAVKVALIKDAAFFEWLEAHAGALVNRGEKAMAALVYRCAALHLEHIASGDPFESGSSRPLDFGHWSAHKLEQLSRFAVLHGEAVAAGIALDTCYSRHIGWMGEQDAERILSLLRKLQFDLYHPLLEDPNLMNGLEEFREHLGGELTIMLLKGIGHGENIHVIHTGIMADCIHFLKEYEQNKKSISKTSVS